jgi:EAL domain-containing protein (putative c-di-GMP-specific phosphodiesterase class I)
LSSIAQPRAADAAICQTAIDLAHSFGAAAVAEGVEHAADLQALIVMGCDFGQGAAIAPLCRAVAPAHEQAARCRCETLCLGQPETRRPRRVVIFAS